MSWQGLQLYVRVLLLSLTVLPRLGHSQLTGTTEKCMNEGGEVYIPSISDNPCITCWCQDGEVTCMKEKCKPLDGCHMILFDRPGDQCCDICRGCDFRGQHYASGAEWRDPVNPCQIYTCQAGVVTSSKAVCHIPCKNPVHVPGKCCPVCEGCSLDDEIYSNGARFPSPRDPCATCRCENGSVQCERQACPVLNCPVKNVIFNPGSCCPVCGGSRQIFDPLQRACLFRNQIYTNETKSSPDTCTNCTCVDGTTVCERQVCPALNCGKGKFKRLEGQCCPICEKPKKRCRFQKRKYKHGATWRVEKCTNCLCEDGVARCQMEQCGNSLECPMNSRLQTVPGKCCPECVDEDAVCAVFGDPHYRTFDGRIYNFQGNCSYILAQDCKDRKFSVRVRNEARLNNNFAWTKTVSMVIGEHKISLQQRLKVKVGGKRVTLPYEEEGVFQLMEGGHSVTLRTSLGVKLIWDGDSYLELSVPPAFKSHMCGLCGNFNNMEIDDFIGRDKVLYFEANEFGETWRQGRRRCGRRRQKVESAPPCPQDKTARQRAERQCSVFRNAAFAQCRDKVDMEPYYRSCLVDMCDCPTSKQCACESLTAYARACSREGIHIRWKTPSLCGAPACPKGASYNVCASTCPRTCSNWSEPVRCEKPCEAGCQCPAGKVLHRNRCIKPERCRKKSLEGATSSKS